MPDRGTRGRLGVYVDDVYRVREGDATISTDRAFLLFVCEVGGHFDGLVLFGRTRRSEERADYVLPATAELAPLPDYESLGDVRDVVRASFGTARGMWKGLADVDTVWVFGPHPYALLLVLLALLRRRRVVLGVRQDTVAYHRARLRSRRSPLLLVVRALDSAYRVLARRVPTTVVGPAIARRYGGDSPSLLVMTVTLVRAGDVSTDPMRDWPDPARLLTVGRLEPEKNPSLLIRALARLRRHAPGSARLTWVGRGALEGEVRALADELGVRQEVEIRGYVPFGPELLGLYRDADLFVHVSRTEGVPQVLVEALASGTPVVATDVGGVRSLLDDGRAGLLVPPDDEDALVEAIARVRDDAELRERLVARGLELARERTLESEASRVAEFLRARSSSAPQERARTGAKESEREADV